ncbi:hypothetical protein [Erythrobacter sp. JK5]|uniref:hypothetical protein n=1 Tax=Erythrobacter sp. JK5 TaxID=2829500 RepID=UPI001BA65A4F|nr:hypothetical protein [Erythrobacter sp. JK5]QUL38362.1 hypothetical protein KDC96_02805 [Erythrobacter sp. JK5]
MPFGSRMVAVGRQGRRFPLTLAASALFAVFAAPVHAQSGEKHDSVGEDAVDAVTQPLSDLNLRSKDIPLLLTLAQQAPYDLTNLDDCDALRGEVGRLDEVLGPDADAPQDEEGLVNKGLKTGGNILGGMIPFRGLVRQLSGAKAEEKRWEAAIYAGVARRSYLKGYMAGKSCLTSEEETIRSARDVLNLSE